MSAVSDQVMSEQYPSPNGSVGNEVAPHDGALSQLERQVERGSFFTHTALGENHLRLNEVESFTYGLIDALLVKGVISSTEVSTAVENVREELINKGEGVGVGVALRLEADEVADQPPVEVDCAARMHVCHAVCCRLDFALSQSEVEAGNIKWDLGRPYFIRHEANGRCAHLLNQDTGGCNVYATRPSVCRGYSCADDKRIWKDFEKMEINDEWISENLYATRPRALKVLMNYAGCAQSSCVAEAANERQPD